MRRAKIVCTLGPASSSPQQIDRLIEAGADCARLNFSHGDHESHKQLAHLVREAAVRARRPVAILADLAGPKMRVRKFRDGEVMLEPGQRFVLTTRDVPGTRDLVSVTYPQLPKDLQKGDTVLLDDGLVRLRVTNIDGEDVQTEVEVGGSLSDNKGLNLPGAKLSTPALTDKDRRDLSFAVHKLHVDYVALSFVRAAQDVREAQSLAEGTPVIAKMEKPEAIENLESIAEVAYGLMVARGDLGVEMGSEKVPMIQKKIIQEVNRRGKLVITATQMLDSMMRNPRPTRAEAADVANAVIDGTDALMLSGETATGKYPVEAARMMATIIGEVERDMLASRNSLGPTTGNALLADLTEWQLSNASARAAALLSHALPLSALVVFTGQGRTASLISDYRPRAPIVAITSDPRVANRLALLWGVRPYVEIPPDDMEETQRIASALLVREKICQSGDIFGLVAGWPPSARPNTVKLHRL